MTDDCRKTPYSPRVITIFQHPGLKELYRQGRLSEGSPGARPETPAHPHRPRSKYQSGGHGYPGFRVHPLKGRMRGLHATVVSGTWWMTFRFEDGDAVDVDYLDDHQESLPWQCTPPSTPAPSFARTA